MSSLLRELAAQLEVRVVVVAIGEVRQATVTTRDRVAKAMSNAQVEVEVT